MLALRNLDETEKKIKDFVIISLSTMPTTECHIIAKEERVKFAFIKNHYSKESN